MIKIEWMIRLFPFLTWKPLINAGNLKSDLIAGLTGAVIVLPQGVAFAMIAGLPPQYGMYTAMVTPIVAAMFGSSWHLISGPTTAISIVVFSAISQYAEPGSAEFIRLTLTLTFLAGMYQFGFGLLRLGALVNFVSPNVIMGFTAGAAFLIATSQIKHILGIVLPRGGSFINTWLSVVQNAGSTNYYVLLIALTTLISAIVIKLIIPKGPVLLLAMLVASFVSILIEGKDHGVQMVGEITAYLPQTSTPDFSILTIRTMAPKAFAVALLGLIEAVSISRSVAALSQQKVDGNQEFIGQGLSNIVGSFFSSYAGSGSFTRTGINFEAGAKSPLAAIFSAFFLLLILFFLAPLMAFLPIASMGGIIFLVAYNLIEFKHIKSVLKTSRPESIVLSITFFSTLFLDLEFAIYSGVLFSLFFYLNRTAKPSIFSMAPDPEEPRRNLINLERKPLVECPQLKIIRLDGSLFFGAINHVEENLESIKEQGLRYEHILILGESINSIDMAGADMLAQQANQLHKKGGGLYLVGFKNEAVKILYQSQYLNMIGKHNIFESVNQAISTIDKKLDLEKCYLCHRNIFGECLPKKS
ncbi:MAG: SulP family inorganic anion transporter [Deltaproteobacteria bacterium]|jgi:sulfate permease, SulP family|nr:SulP family inorganic anion transporter [Deltaproteobacteria bacterium]